MNDNEFSKTIIQSIKDSIRNNIDEEYTTYKNKCLDELNYKLETKRNDTIKAILNGIDIYVNNNQPYSLEPIINIKIEKKVYIKGENYE